MHSNEMTCAPSRADRLFHIVGRFRKEAFTGIGTARAGAGVSLPEEQFPRTGFRTIECDEPHEYWSPQA